MLGIECWKLMENLSISIKYLALTVQLDSITNYVMIKDNLPAGFEAINPAYVEMMYMPEVNGGSESRRIVIK